MNGLVSDAGIFLPAKSLGDQLEAELRHAMNHHFKRGWSIADVNRYCQRVKLAGDEAETFYIDGKPMLRIWQAKTEIIGRKLRMTQKVERLY